MLIRDIDSRIADCLCPDDYLPSAGSAAIIVIESTVCWVVSDKVTTVLILHDGLCHFAFHQQDAAILLHTALKKSFLFQGR